MSSFVIKICGITSLEDARVAVEAGANAIGLNFYPKSPRYISVERAAEIAAFLPSSILKVGIFVVPPVAAGANDLVVCDQVPLDVVQLHGADLPLSALKQFRVWRACSISNPPAPDPAVEAYLVDSHLVDSPSPHFGGSGQTFDWSSAASFPRRILIAGGLDGTNVAAAIEAASPWGVDACSRLESSPGRKDPARVRDFVQAALAAFRRPITL
jgi:phosphoribosylanthranilate isomerase